MECVCTLNEQSHVFYTFNFDIPLSPALQNVGIILTNFYTKSVKCYTCAGLQKLKVGNAVKKRLTISNLKFGNKDSSRVKLLQNPFFIVHLNASLNYILAIKHSKFVHLRLNSLHLV